MNAALKKFMDDMTSCGYEYRDTINRAHSIVSYAMRDKAEVHRKEFRKALDKMDKAELSELINEITRLEGGE